MTIVYQKSLPGSNSWEDVKTLNEIPVEAWPHVFALLDDGQAFTCPEPLEFVGVRFRAVFEDAPFSTPYNPLIAVLCLRLQQAELDMEYWKEQAGLVTERDTRFKRAAENLRDRIVKQLAMLATSQAEAFAGSHNERHQKLAAVMTQIPALVALCEEIPSLLTHATNDIPF